MFPTAISFAESTSSTVPSGHTRVLPVEVQGEYVALRKEADEGKSTKDVAKLVETGVAQMNRNDLAGAKTTFKKVLKADPGNKYAWYNLGVMAHWSNEQAAARKSYDKALKADPKFGPALFNEAVLIQANDPDRAVVLLKRAIASNPKASTAHFLLGEILAKKAKDSFARAVEIDPKLRSQVPAGFLG
ncbi:tetratricopeptide repeat protein [Streptomyces sp. NPDC058572]|uniref:tetratricopeptide repeat protein n=1 Tax=Streptomyces sp. NPDC058572 TaxID=3346546 RepID=UPI0036467307